MKRKIAKALILAIILTVGLAGCEKKTQENTGNSQTQENKIEDNKENTDIEEKKPDEKSETFIFTNEKEDITVNIPKKFELVEIENVTQEQGKGTEGNIYKFKSETEMLEISDLVFGDVEVNEAFIEEEVSLASGLEVLRMDHFDTPVTKVFGLLAHDTATDKYMFYHRFKKDDRIISVIQMSNVAYNIDEEAQNKAMLMSIKFL